MEYLVGFFVGIILIILFYRSVIRDSLSANKLKQITYSQSHIVSILRPLSPASNSPKADLKESQASEYEKLQSVRVVMTESQAYWIRNNVFYTADIGENYSIDKNSTRRVDTMSMDRVQLEKIMFIVDKLTKGDGNENSDPGHPRL